MFATVPLPQPKVCGFDSQTEVLTLFGWKRIEFLRREEVAVFSPEEKTIYFQEPLFLSRNFFRGKLSFLKGRQFNCLHSFHNPQLVSICRTSYRHKSKKRKDTWQPHQFLPMSDLLGSNRKYLKAANLAECDRVEWTNPWGILPQEFARLVGFFAGDGVRPEYSSDDSLLRYKLSGQIRFKLKRDRKIDFLYSIKGIEVQKRASDRYVINLPGIGRWFSRHCYNEQGEKKLPRGYLTLTKQEVEGLLDGLKNSDGHVMGKNWRYSSSSTYLLDQIQALCAVNNLVGSWTTAFGGSETRKPVYNVHVSGDRLTPAVNRKQCENSCVDRAIDYEGYLYHPKVDGALILRRERKVIFG